MAAILVVEDEVSLRQSIAIALKWGGHEPTVVGTIAAALVTLRQAEFDVILADVRLPDGDALGLLASPEVASSGAVCVVMTAFATVDMAVEAMRLGALDLVQKPFSPERLAASLDRALEHRRLVGELRRRRAGLPEIVGVSVAIVAVRERLERATDARAVLLTGETGTGKDLVAHTIHARARPDAPLVVVDCAGLPQHLLEVELFGGQRGAAGERAKRGLLAESEGGTLFFDEVGELPAELQPRLLRFLETGETRAVAGKRAARPPQIIAASNRDLAGDAIAGRFRRDLLHRLAGYRIHLPPLRERPEDLELLAHALLARVGERIERIPPRLTDDAVAALRSHSWPGNVRELEHELERAFLLVDDEPITADLLFDRKDGPSPGPGESLASVTPMADIERTHILAALDAARNNRAATARALGISKSTLRRKLIQYGRWTQGGEGDGDGGEAPDGGSD